MTKREPKDSKKDFKLMIDADILLDVLLDRKPFCGKSSLVWKMCETGLVKGFVSTLSFANIVYIMRRELDAKSIERVLGMLSQVFHFESLSGRDLKKAASLYWDDFEDAVQYSIAARIHADYIITRNIMDYQQSTILPMTPEEFLLEGVKGR